MYLLEMSAVLEPRSGHGDVIGSGLARSLDQDGKVESVLARPRLEGLEDLEAVRGGRNLDVDGGAVSGGSLVGVVSGVVAPSGESVASGRSEQELVAVLVLQLIGERVEGKGASNAEGDDQIGGSDERVGGRVSVISAGKVSVVRGQD